MMRAAVIVGVLVVCLWSAPASAQVGGPFDLTWNTIDAGGGTSLGGAFVLSGTIGQHDAGPVMTGGAFTLTGGFWPGLGETCTADFNSDGQVNSQDFFDFLSAFFSAAPSADFNHDGQINSQDFFDFLTAFFAGCP